MGDLTEGSSGFDIKFHDNGDGSYSPYVTVLSSTGQTSAAVVNGQFPIGTTAMPLPSHALTQGVTVESLSTNSVSVFVGALGVTTSGTTGGIELPPGAAVTVVTSNTSTVYVISTAPAQIVSFIGS